MTNVTSHEIGIKVSQNVMLANFVVIIYLIFIFFVAKILQVVAAVRIQSLHGVMRDRFLFEIVF